MGDKKADTVSELIDKAMGLLKKAGFKDLLLVGAGDHESSLMFYGDPGEVQRAIAHQCLSERGLLDFFI